MKIYVVMKDGRHRDDEGLFGVFSTRELAREFIDAGDEDGEDEDETFSIYETELDGRESVTHDVTV